MGQSLDLMNIREVVVFSEQGDPARIKTWSNVPYFLVNTLRERGIRVHTIDLSVKSLPEKAIRFVHEAIFSRVAKNSHYPYSTSLVSHWFSRLKVYFAIRKHATADLLLFTTFSISASRLTARPSILFCDWTIEYYLDYFVGRKPNFLERITIRRQNRTIEEARAVFVLFPVVARAMKDTYANPNIYYNGNVVNSLEIPQADIVQRKQRELKILFVGSAKYAAGARQLISAYNVLKKEFPALSMDLVGVVAGEIGGAPDGVTCHGYLDKSIERDARLYYGLLREASVFVNTTPKWASFSSSLEAMYFYTPVIVPPYAEFVETFGREIKFGQFYEGGQQNLPETIQRLFRSPLYPTMCQCAHEAVSLHNWPNYVDGMLKKIVDIG